MRLYQQRKSTLLSLQASPKHWWRSSPWKRSQLLPLATHGDLTQVIHMVSSIPLTRLVEQEDHTQGYRAWNGSNRSIVYKKYVSFVGNRESPPKKLAQMQLLQTKANRQALKISKCFCLRYIIYVLFLSFPFAYRNIYPASPTHELLVSQVRKEEHGWLPATIFLEG